MKLYWFAWPTQKMQQLVMVFFAYNQKCTKLQLFSLPRFKNATICDGFLRLVSKMQQIVMVVFA